VSLNLLLHIVLYILIFDFGAIFLYLLALVDGEWAAALERRRLRRARRDAIAVYDRTHPRHATDHRAKAETPVLSEVHRASGRDRSWGRMSDQEMTEALAVANGDADDDPDPAGDLILLPWKRNRLIDGEWGTRPSPAVAFTYPGAARLADTARLPTFTDDTITLDTPITGDIG
jgi:hypothetical protein